MRSVLRCLAAGNGSAMLLAEQVRVRLQRGNFTGAEQLQRQLEQMAASFRMDAEHPCQRAIVMSASLSRSRLLRQRPSTASLRFTG